MILPRPSVSPLPSWASRPGVIPTRRTPSFPEMFWQLVRWWRGYKPSLREIFREQRIVEEIAADLERADSPVIDASPRDQKPGAKRAHSPGGR